MFRFLILILIALPSFLPAKTGITPERYPNLLIYRMGTNEAHCEVLFTGNLKRLTKSLRQQFQTLEKKPAELVESDSGFVLRNIGYPNLIGDAYIIETQYFSSPYKGIRMEIRVKSDGFFPDLLNPKSGAYRKLMAAIQAAIDDCFNIDFSPETQNPNNLYLFEPKSEFKNLYSYLFFYSREPADSIMPVFVETLSLACETPRTGSWVSDSTFRIDNLYLPELGYLERFSLTVVWSTVQDGFNQYEIYLSNYRPGDEENNYEIRLHDLHYRLWRFYSTELARRAFSK